MDGYPFQLQPIQVTDPGSANPAQDVKMRPSKRSAGSEEESHKGVTGRIVGLGKKLARLFYHPVHRHSTAAQPKSTSHRKSQDEDVDEKEVDD
jgi:hypothetical protein